MIEDSIPFWCDFLLMGLLLSTVIAYPTVAVLVTRPIQQKLRQTKQDYISDWVVWPFQSGVYAMAIVVPFARWRNERNRGFVDALQPVRQAATSFQWWLSLWLEVSLYGMVMLGFFMMAMDALGVWSHVSV